MKAEIFFTIIILIIGSHTSVSQVLSCNYRNDSYWGYSCDLLIFNPNGFNNFTTINGTHLSGMSDNDVRTIETAFDVNLITYSTNVPTIICEKFNNLEMFLLYSAGVEKIDENSFKNCKVITMIDLFSNRITAIDENSFIENKKLEILDLSGNRLTTLAENLFISQQNLSRLVIYMNKISDLPKTVFAPLESLSDLDLSANIIERLTIEWFQGTKNLKNLHLSLNQIEELPPNVFSSMKNLTRIFINNNKLKVIHANSFGILPILTIIDLSKNQIDAIDENLIDNTGVVRINTLNNSCANLTIIDNSTLREAMRNDLRNCFENYKILYPETTTTITSSTFMPTTPPSGCIYGNLDERVCRLEDDNQEFHENFNKIEEQNQELVAVTDDLQDQIDNLTKQNEDLNKKLESQSAALEELQEQVLILSTRPCSCY